MFASKAVISSVTECSHYLQEGVRVVPEGEWGGGARRPERREQGPEPGAGRGEREKPGGRAENAQGTRATKRATSGLA